MVLQAEQGKAPEEAEGTLQEKPGKNKGIPQEIQERSQEQEETEVTPEEIYSKTASQKGRQEAEKGKLGLVPEISPGILPQEQREDKREAEEKRTAKGVRTPAVGL